MQDIFEVVKQRCAVEQAKAAASTWMCGRTKHGVRKEVPEYTMFADDIVLCGGKERVEGKQAEH